MRTQKILLSIIVICLLIGTTFFCIGCKEEEVIDNTVYCEVTFLNWDGRMMQITKCEQGTSPLLPPIPTRSEDEDNTYIFSGWSENLNCVTENMTVTAQYDATYIPKVVWMLDGELYTKGLKYQFKNPPEVIDGDMQVVWYTQEEGGQKVDSSFVGGLSLDEEDVLFYGRWEEIIEEEEEE